ncbi:14872_t:CDS:2, partial [Cetraspora pellucida]
MVEQLTLNQEVGGSNPLQGTRIIIENLVNKYIQNKSIRKFVNKDSETKIIDYLKKLEKNEIYPPISSKKKNLLLASKKEYERLDQEQKDYQELSQEANKEECDFLLKEIENLQEQKEQLISKIREQIMAEEETGQNVVVEIRPHAGGKEAELFVGDLYRIVVILPEAQDINLNIRDQDLKIETYSSGGPGGQHANKTASA